MLSERYDGKNAKERRPVGGAPLWLSLLFLCWERPQPELSLQLVYLWGVTATGGYWQGTPGGFSRGLAEVPLSALLPPTSWARKKSARPPGRAPAIHRRRLRLGFRPAGPGRMATPYGESKGGLWPSLNVRRRSAALAAGEERI